MKVCWQVLNPLPLEKCTGTVIWWWTIYGEFLSERFCILTATDFLSLATSNKLGVENPSYCLSWGWQEGNTGKKVGKFLYVIQLFGKSPPVNDQCQCWTLTFTSALLKAWKVLVVSGLALSSVFFTSVSFTTGADDADAGDGFCGGFWA